MFVKAYFSACQTSPDPRAALRSILAEIIAALGATSGSIALLNPDTGRLEIEVHQGLPADTWRLCLNHRPSDWPLARKAGARLTLSGHTHGGQVNLIPGVSSALLLGPYTKGHYRKGEDQLYVSSGLGVVGLPLRIASPAEITVITLRRG